MELAEEWVAAGFERLEDQEARRPRRQHLFLAQLVALELLGPRALVLDQQAELGVGRHLEDLGVETAGLDGELKARQLLAPGRRERERGQQGGGVREQARGKV